MIYQYSHGIGITCTSYKSPIWLGELPHFVSEKELRDRSNDTYHDPSTPRNLKSSKLSFVTIWTTMQQIASCIELIFGNDIPDPHWNHYAQYPWRRGVQWYDGKGTASAVDIMLRGTTCSIRSMKASIWFLGYQIGCCTELGNTLLLLTLSAFVPTVSVIVSPIESHCAATNFQRQLRAVVFLILIF